jgi:four helix bundle protein
MKNEPLRNRTKNLALRAVRMYCRLPRSPEAQVLGKQALRAGTSVGANYREASRARSNAEFVAKLGIVEQELDKLYWLELLVESGIVPEGKMRDLHQEADELLRMTIAAIKKARSQE